MLRNIFAFTFFLFSYTMMEAQDTIPSPQNAQDLKETITDSTIMVPEGLSGELDSLLTDWFLRNHTYIDSTCISSPVNELYPDSVYIQRLAALPTIIEMPYNPVIRSYIDLYTQKKRSLVEYMLGLSTFYFPLFEKVLDREGAPLELKYLPIIESALKPTARSRAGAAGLWQFMLPTGKIMGLEINSLIDERCDPIKSTEAAVKYLKQLYDTYNDWNLAIAAYNCGPGNVNKAIKRAGGKTDYWDIYFYLPRETRGYVPAFIAANYVMNYYCEHNLCPVKTEMPTSSDTIIVNNMMHFAQISESLNIPMDQLRMLNPQFRYDIIPGNVHPITLRLPLPQLYTFIEHQDTIASYRSKELLVNNRRIVSPGGREVGSGTSIHRVRSGETLGSIAKKNHTTVSKIKQLNHLHSDRLRIGQQLIVNNPYAAKSEIAKSSSRNTSSISTNASTTHKVRSGETLWIIAQKHPGITADMIKKANNLSSSNIKVGQILRIPTL